VSKVLVVYDSSRNLEENVTGGGFFLFIGLLVYKFIGLVVYWFIGDLLSSCKVDGLEADNIRFRRYGKPSRDFSHQGTRTRRKMLAHFAQPWFVTHETVVILSERVHDHATALVRDTRNSSHPFGASP
jgi:hypothetical protein